MYTLVSFHVYKLLYLQVCLIQPEFHVGLTKEKDVSKYKQWRNSLNIVGQILIIPTSSLSEEERVGCQKDAHDLFPCGYEPVYPSIPEDKLVKLVI